APRSSPVWVDLVTPPPPTVTPRPGGRRSPRQPDVAWRAGVTPTQSGAWREDVDVGGVVPATARVLPLTGVGTAVAPRAADVPGPDVPGVVVAGVVVGGVVVAGVVVAGVVVAGVVVAGAVATAAFVTGSRVSGSPVTGAPVA